MLARVKKKKKKKVLSRSWPVRPRKPPTRSAISNSTGFPHRVAPGKDELTFQPREFRLLEYLMKQAGQVVTAPCFLENVWDYHFDPQTGYTSSSVHISRLSLQDRQGFEAALAAHDPRPPDNESVTGIR